MKTTLVTNYTFDKSAKTITFTDFVSINQNQVLSITDVTAGVQIYWYKSAGFGGSVATNVLTLDYDTNNGNFADSDKLLIEYVSDNLPLTGLASAARTTTGQTGSIELNSTGVIMTVDVTAVSGTTPTLVVKLQYYDSVSATWIDVTAATTTTINAIGASTLVVHPSVAEVANAKVAYPLPRIIRAHYTIGGTTPSFTFSIGFNPTY